MANLTLRQIREIQHDKEILNQADKIWGREGLVGKMRVKRRASLIIKKASLDENKKVLEIGCGTGEFTYYLSRSKSKIIATDIFKEFLDIARKKASFSNVQFQCARGESLENFSNNYFDVVCGISILHHLDIELALKNIYRVLKPKGIMIFSEPNMLNPQILIQKNITFIKKILGDSPDETAFFRWQIRCLLEKNNFENINVIPFDFLHPFLPKFFVPPAKGINYLLEKIPLIKELAGSLLISAQKPSK